MCQCDCGNTIIVKHSNLKTTKGTRSCGCLKQYMNSISHRKHGDTNHKLYHIYKQMIRRCTCKTCKDWEYYGSRGIHVTPEWLTPPDGYIRFRQYAYQIGYHDQPEETPYREMLSIDRIDPNGNYEPGNIRFIPMKDQANNMRTCHIYEIGGRTYTMIEIHRKFDISMATLISKARDGWSNSAVSFWIEHPEVGLYRRSRDGVYLDKDGFIRLIPERPLIYTDPRYDHTGKAKRWKAARRAEREAANNANNG